MEKPVSAYAKELLSKKPRQDRDGKAPQTQAVKAPKEERSALNSADFAKVQAHLYSRIKKLGL